MSQEPVRGVLFPEPAANGAGSPPATAGGGPPADRIMLVAHGFMAAKIVFLAVEVGLFAAIGGGRSTLEEIAQACRLPVRTTRMLVDALVMFRLVECDGERYRNAADAEEFLTGRGSLDIRPVLQAFDKISYPAWLDAETAIRTGQGVRKDLAPAEIEAFEKSVSVVTMPGATSLAAEYDFCRHRRVLDIGGGMGTFMIPVLSKHDHLTWTLCDLPRVADLARGSEAVREFGDRVDVVGADVFTDPLPAGYDAILVAHFLHLYPPEKDLDLLGRLRGLATEDGRLLLVDWWLDPVTPHPNTVFGAFQFLLASGGDAYRPDEVERWLSQTGWQAVEHRPLVAPMSLLVAEAA
jgi:protein-L-isoaspartate O-methyltransferase